MDKKHQSLTKLPSISIKKKDKIVMASRRFEEEFKVIADQERINTLNQTNYDSMFVRKANSSYKTINEDHFYETNAVASQSKLKLSPVKKGIPRDTPSELIKMKLT